jgi:uncharacterized repeat protein (TIGR01451 family)
MRSFLSFFFLAIIFYSNSAYSQTYLDIKTFGSDNFNDEISGLATDKDDNMVFCGTFKDQITIGDTTLICKGVSNIFLAKFNSMGELIWAARAGGESISNYPTGLAIDHYGNIFIIGVINGNVDFGPITMSITDGRQFLAKYSATGTPQWANPAIGLFGLYNTIATDDQGYVYVGGGNNVTKYTNDGIMSWEKTVAHTNSEGYIYPNIKSICIKKDVLLVAGIYKANNGMYIGTKLLNSNTGPDGNMFTAKLDTTGIIHWGRGANSYYLCDGTGTGIDAAGNCYISGQAGSKAQFDHLTNSGVTYSGGYLAKYNAQGTIQWLKPVSYEAAGFGSMTALYTDDWGYSYTTGYYSRGMTIDNFSKTIGERFGHNYETFIAKISPEGGALWLENIRADTVEFGKVVTRNSKGVVTFGGITYSTKVVAGKYTDVNKRGKADGFLCKILDHYMQSQSGNLVTGKIYQETSGNCVPNVGESPLPSFVVQAEPGPHYAISNEKGEYKLSLEEGNYSIKHYPPAGRNNYKKTFCDNEYNISLTGSKNFVEKINFSDSVFNCSILTVDVGSNFRRMAGPTSTIVSYCNEGTASATNVSIQVVYPKYFRPVISSIPWSTTLSKDSLFVFNIGTVLPGACGRISLKDVMIAPDINLTGLTQCTKARILPSNPCGNSSGQWDNSTLEVFGGCKGSGVVEMGVTNVGSGSMQDSSQVLIYLDNKIVDIKKVKIDSRDTIRYRIEAQGKTVRFEAKQSINNPLPGNPLFWVEACDAGSGTSKGFVNQMSMEDIGDHYAVDCLPILNGYDPNEKRIVPEGIGNNHYVASDQELEFTLLFQNLGTDTVFNIRVVDTLSQYLDFTTFRKGVSSHNYELFVSGTGKPVLEWRFSNILLPTAKTDSVKSNGFIKFRISPKANVTKGTKINNKGFIYFDYNPPIVTNEPEVTIYDTTFTGPLHDFPSTGFLTTTSIADITFTGASSGGTISDDGGSAITSRGICWSTFFNPTIAHNKTSDGTGTGSFTSTLTGLSSGTTYYVRAYATNQAGTAYGNKISFTTPIPLTLATLTTNTISFINITTVTGGGSITNSGGSAITDRGICWSTNPKPTTEDTKISSGAGPGNFTSSLTALLPGTTYYVRAYAINSTGTAYGNEREFKTNAMAGITTTDITDLTITSAESGGIVTNNGGGTVYSKGVCWSTSSNPTIFNSKTNHFSGDGIFTSSITGLSAGTTYYVRAYATNSAGTAYGNEISFTTPASVALPVINTTTIISITESTALSGGNITNNGGGTVTDRGICWSTFPNPTTSDNKTNNGTGSGNYSASLTELSSATIYYVRAFATNSAGTAYGNEISFTTSVGTGLNNSALKNNISIYPSPGNGMIVLDIHSLNSDYLKCRVLNSKGEIVYNGKVNNFSGDYKGMLDLSFLPKGFYTIQIITSNGIFTDKLIISE